MITVADIHAFLDTIAPSYMKMDWDRIGQNCGHKDQPVTRILVALDPFKEVCQEAKALGAELLVTHHALIWEPGFVTDETQSGQNTLYLIENGIAHINAHTNLDCAPGGVNDTLATCLGLSNIAVVDPAGTDADGIPYGLLRMGKAEKQPLGQFLALIKKKLGCRGLKYVSGNKDVEYVCVGGGACGSELMSAYRAGCDTFVTADLKYNTFWDAHDLGINLIDAGHFYTEVPVCSMLVQKLQEAFPQVDIRLSNAGRDPSEYYI